MHVDLARSHVGWVLAMRMAKSLETQLEKLTKQYNHMEKMQASIATAKERPPFSQHCC